MYRDNTYAKPIVFSSPPTSFEISASTFSSANNNFIFVVIYRPGSAAVRELFFTELTNVFDALATFNHHVIITGDFNIRVNDGDDKNSRKLAELLQSCGFVLSVVGPTHTHGDTLDLVITRVDLPRPVVTVDLPRISDPSLIRIGLSIPCPPLQFIDVSSRAWKSFYFDRFRSDLLSGPLCQPDVYNGMSIDQLQELYDTTLSTLLEKHVKHAPRQTARRRFQPLTPWFDSECDASKRKMRALERQYHRTRNPDDRLAWIEQTRSMHQLFKQKQNLSREAKVEDSRGNPKKLWRTLSTVLGKDKKNSTSSKELTANDFLKAFTEKTEGVRQSTSTASYPTFDETGCPYRFLEFESVDCESISRLIQSSPNKNCTLDRYRLGWSRNTPAN